MTTPTRKQALPRNTKLTTPRSSTTRPKTAAPADAPAALDDAAIYKLAPRLATSGPHRGKLRPTKTFLGGGLYVLTTLSGAHSFRFPYSDPSGKPQTWTLGVHGPELSLSQARAEHKRIREQLGKLVPAEELREVARVARGDGRSFQAEAQSWLDAMRPHWSARYHDQVTSMLTRDVFAPKGVAHPLGSRALATITPPMVLKCVQRVEQRGAVDAASDLCAVIAKVFSRAVNLGSGGITTNPASDTHKELVKRTRSHFDAAAPDDLPRVFADIREREKSGELRRLAALALKLMIHTCVRTDTLRHTRWDWIDFDAREIRYPDKTPGLCKANDMPDAPDYVVPLSEQALELLAEIEKLSEHSELLFPNRSEPWRPCSNGTWLVALKRAGWTGDLDKDDPEYRPNLTVHGFRSTFRTIAGHDWASTRQREYAIEVQMDHQLDDDTLKQLKPYLRAGGTYRELFPEQRRELMNWWSAHLAKCEAMQPKARVTRQKRDTAKGGRASNALMQARKAREAAASRSEV